MTLPLLPATTSQAPSLYPQLSVILFPCVFTPSSSFPVLSCTISLFPYVPHVRLFFCSPTPMPDVRSLTCPVCLVPLVTSSSQPISLFVLFFLFHHISFSFSLFITSLIKVGFYFPIFLRFLHFFSFCPPPPSCHLHHLPLQFLTSINNFSTCNSPMSSLHFSRL